MITAMWYVSLMTSTSGPAHARKNQHVVGGLALQQNHVPCYDRVTLKDMQSKLNTPPPLIVSAHLGGMFQPSQRTTTTSAGWGLAIAAPKAFVNACQIHRAWLQIFYAAIGWCVRCTVVG
jgi:hypothetical protein